MTRPGCLALAALTIVFMAGFAVGRASASRPAVQQADRSTGHERMTTERVSPLPSPDFAGRRTEAPRGSPGASPSPSQGRVTPSPRPTRMQPAATARPRAATPARVSRTVRGIASTYGPGWNGWLALPEGPGIRVRICGAGGCAVRTSTDAGPSLAGQRTGRVADLDVPTFERVCGIPWTRGLCRVRVEYLR